MTPDVLPMRRRLLTAAAVGVGLQVASYARQAEAEQADAAPADAAHADAAHAQSAKHTAALDAGHSRAFRAWFVAILLDQVRREPSPRWFHRDCAGLVRFAAQEALRPHDDRWMQAMGWDRSRPMPPEVALRPDQQDLGQRWALPDGSRAAYAGALALVQNNTRPIGRERQDAERGDLLFFDQGDDQHLMVWTGDLVVYHTGSDPRPDDNGLRRLRWESLTHWPDTRWRPSRDNANYAGLYRWKFLA